MGRMAAEKLVAKISGFADAPAIRLPPSCPTSWCESPPARQASDGARSLAVIPAQAGIHLRNWIPVSPGTTALPSRHLAQDMTPVTIPGQSLGQSAIRVAHWAQCTATSARNRKSTSTEPRPAVPRRARHARRRAAALRAVTDLPIISPHGHTDPEWFAGNAPFANATELLLAPDHYLYRMLYSPGRRWRRWACRRARGRAPPIRATRGGFAEPSTCSAARRRRCG